MKLRYQLPTQYAQWLPSSLLDLNPAETKATCDACAMSPGRTRTKHKYREDLKCCTFHPWLPNYSVGAILKDDSITGAKARATLREKIRAREYSLPIGVVPSVRYQVEFNRRAPEEFGNREDWLCPYYDREANLCGVWRNRGSVCTSFYCKSDQGQAGKRFWKNLENFLSYTEMALMEECLAMMDFSPRQVSELLGYLNRYDGTAQEKRSWVIPEAKARALWNGYFENQEGFFLKCAQIVEELAPAQFQEAIGDNGEFLLETTLMESRCFR